jgi:hypothetical protein
MTHIQRREALETQKERLKRDRERERLTRFLCKSCRQANAEGRTHPGVQHQPGICDCPCR